MSRFRIIQDNPCPAQIAPYIYLVTKGATVNSIYRGTDAATILHAHGKHTQAEIHQMYPAISNPEGQSTHDGHTGGAFPGPKTAKGAWWMQGFDVNDQDVAHCERLAVHHGWKLFRPYPRGAEFHHLCFAAEPRPYGRVMRARLVAIRARLRRS